MGNPILTNYEVSSCMRQTAKDMILERTGDSSAVRHLMNYSNLHCLLGALGMDFDDPEFLRRAGLHKNNKGFYSNWTERAPRKTSKRKETHS